MTRSGQHLCVAALALAALASCGDDAKPQPDDSTEAAGAPSSAGEAAGGAEAADNGQAGATTPGLGGDDSGGKATGDSLGGAGELVDPCHGVSAQGQCLSEQQAQSCVVPTGNGTPMLVTTSCRSFEHCDASSGQARCVLEPGACIPEQAECVNAKQLRQCNANGVWQTRTCAGACQASAIGGFCVKGSPTAPFQGTLHYEAVPVYDDYSDWARTSVYLPATGVLVLSGDGSEWLDAALVGANGAFSLQVPTTNTGLEQLAFFLIHPDPTGAVAELGVFDPNVPNGVVSTDARFDGQAWSWALALSDISSGEAIRIDENQGSGAIHVFERLLQVQGYISEFYQAKPGSLAAWFHLNTAWDCGTCFAPWPVEVSSTPFDSQLFISATAQDRSYWSDAVTVHEAGHYAMWSYGVSPNEGGPHCLGVPTSPGQAWSEGWATGFSSLLRDSPIYWDKQKGAMFWFDLQARQYDQLSWQRPSSQNGLRQDIDENEVAAMLWSLSQDASVGAESVLLGLRAPSVVGARFRRRYTRHVWDMQDCQRVNYFDTRVNAPMFADYLDGLVCGGVPAESVDQATNPAQFYPYPSREPLCP